MSLSFLTLPDSILSSPYLSALLPLTIGNLIGFFTRPRNTYRHLHQPPLSPPAWIFAPVWSLLYLSMGLSSYLAFPSSRSPLYTLQLLLNFAWMPLFFGLSWTRVALVDCAALTGCVGLLIRQWWGVDRRAGLLLVPYFGWAAFATYLTAQVGRMNGWDVVTAPEKRGRGKEGREKKE
ncbi:TspO/MBR-related protein [Ascodesmis nigricans]|uniref:TspO/MBR-related protein n=1 Tax=Ascodesmis nigricans TaxID=341454 RepID=A0A4S2MU82_9PEZI|nr:TspO/MBR-related protein [Ascodesmis nigricans]